MKCAIFEEHSSSCVVYFRFSGTLFPVSMIDGAHVCTCMYPDFVTCEDQPAYRAVLSAPLFLEQNIKHFVGPDLGPNCLLNKFVTSSLREGVGGWVRHC